MKEEFIEKTGDETVGLSVVFTRKDGSRVQFLPVLDSVVDYFTSIVFEREYVVQADVKTPTLSESLSE